MCTCDLLHYCAAEDEQAVKDTDHDSVMYKRFVVHAIFGDAGKYPRLACMQELFVGINKI